MNAFENLGYEVDYAESCDKPHEILAETLGLSPEQALRVDRYFEEQNKKAGEWILAQAIWRIQGMLTDHKNKEMLVVTLGIAAGMTSGLDSLNGKRNQSKLAAELGVSRSLISHYVCAWSDLLGLRNMSFRKSECAREAYRMSAARGWATRKENLRKNNMKNKQPNMRKGKK